MSNVKKLNEEEFVSNVENSNEVILVDFYATWCKPCTVLAEKLEEFASTSDTKVFKVDIDESKELAKKYDIKKLPTLIVFSAGKKVADKIGITNVAGIKDFVNQAK